MSGKRDRAIVIGASIAGLMAARALEVNFERVTIIEKDVLSPSSVLRKSVPQGAHAHALLSRGKDVIESIFPGIVADLLALGALEVDYLHDMIWVADGRAICPGPSSIDGLLLSRPLLEEQIRTRLLKSARIEILDGTTVSELIASPDRSTVVGILCRRGGEQRSISADLVVDASGRGSRTPEWLRELGYLPPRDERVTVGVSYTTSTFMRRPGDLGGKLGVVIGASDPGWRCGALLAQEKNRWIVSLGGYFGDRAPTDRDGFLDFARSLPVPDLHNAIKDAEPLTPFTTYSFVGSLRRRYEELRRFPERYIVMGDALCSFNPIYGQGMTVAALEALALREGARSLSSTFAADFFKAASRLIDVPWGIIVGNDLRHRRTQGRRDLRLRISNWYLGRLKRRLPGDFSLSSLFLSVSNMKSPPSSLVHPSTIARVFAPWAVDLKRRSTVNAEACTNSFFF